jgi:hypothetical protein
LIISLDKAITVYSNSQQANTTQKMTERGKKITYLKLNTPVEAGGEGLGMNLLTR